MYSQFHHPLLGNCGNITLGKIPRMINTKVMNTIYSFSDKHMECFSYLIFRVKVDSSICSRLMKTFPDHYWIMLVDIIMF